MKFIYGDDGSTSLDLSRLEAEGNEMIYVVSAGYVDKLIPPAFANEIKIGSKVYNYVSGGNAYFTLGGNTVTAFALADEGDSITVGKNQEINVFDDEDPYGNLINVYSGANYTVTKTKYNYTAALTESADIRIGETNLYFEISKATKETLANNPIVITFENDGTIVSVEGLYNLTSTDDKLFVSGEYVTNEYGGLPVISRNGKLEYISVSDGYFTFTGGTEGNQSVEVSQGATVHSLCENLILIMSNVIKNILVSGTNNDDIISNSGSKVTINAGTGNDTIENTGSNVSIDGGTGDDSISNSGVKVTILGGTGDDFIKLGDNASNNVIEYKSGDGNDTIEGFNEDDTLKIGGGKGTYSSLANADDDIIIEVGEEKITLKGAAKLDNVNIDGEYVNPRLIVGTEGNDNIENTLEGATIQALGGKDSVTNSGNNVSIDGGTGDDLISNEGASNVSILGGEGNDSIYNKIFVYQNQYQEFREIIPSNTTLNGGTGDDTISLGYLTYGNLIKYTEGDGNDLIQGFGEDDTLSISGSYSTQESGADLLVKVGEGTITLKDVRTTTVNINGETIEFEKNIALTDGDDSFNNSRDNVTINALGGKDSVTNSGNNVSIDGGKGADYIYTEGNGGVIIAGAGDDSILNCGDSVTIDAGAGNDSIENGDYYWDGSWYYGNDVTINAGDGNDSIRNFGSQISINGDSGNDAIWNKGGSFGTINGGDGNDTIYNRNYVNYYKEQGEEWDEGAYREEKPNYTTIEGGKGADYIYTEGNGGVIIAGAGNDSISLITDAAYNLIQYKSGEGNDTITGLNEDDTLSISGSYSTQKSGADILVKVGKGTITLKDVYVTTETININDETIANFEKDITLTDGNDYIDNYRNNATINALGGDDTIANSVDEVTIDGGEGNDSIRNGISYGSRGVIIKSGSSVKIDGGAGNDTIENYCGDSVSIDGGAGNDYIYFGGQYEILDEEDNYIAREDYAENNTINGGKGNDTISLGYCTYGNLIKYTEGDGNDLIQGFGEYDTLSISGSYSTQESGADLLVKVGEGTITLKDVRITTETININGETIELEKNITLTDGNDYIDNYRNNVTINALGGDDTIANSVDEVTIDGGEGNDSIENYCGDSVSIDGGAGNDTISLGYITYGNLIKYTEGDGNDLIQGFGEYDTLKIVGSSYSTKKSGEDIIVTVGEGKITLEGAAYWDTLNIVSDKPSWTLDGTTATYGTSDNTLATVKGVKSLDGLSLNGKVVTVDKSALGTDKVTISDGYTLALGSDVTKSSISKTAWSHKGTTATYNQTTTAGYTLADDGKSVSYSDAMTTALATVKGAKSAKGLSVSDKKITLKKSALSKKVTVSGDYEFDFASDYKQALITGSTNSDTIIARGSKITINGSDGNDKLYGNAGNDKIYGGNGNDSLLGGKGNDSLWGDAGADKFIYAKGDGKDVIFDFANDDLLQITGTFTGTYNKSKDEAYFKVGSTSSAITLKNFTATTFNINDDTYQISGTKFVKK